jgi:hypothetical protein
MSADEWSAALRALTMCILALILCISICISLFFKNYVDPTALSTVYGATTFVLGYLAGKRTPVTIGPQQAQIEPTQTVTR